MERDEKTLYNLKKVFDNLNAGVLSHKDQVNSEFVKPPGSRSSEFNDIVKRFMEVSRDKIWGTRGVGKTIFLKKAFFNLIEDDEVLPIYLDLNKAFHIINKLKHLEDSRRIHLESKIIDKYYRLMIYKSLLHTLNCKNQNQSDLVDYLLKFFSNLCGVNFKDHQLELIIEQINEQISNLSNPFKTRDIDKAEINLTDSIIGHSEINKNYLNKNLLNIFETIHNLLEVNKFLVIFDEFSKLPKDLQEETINQLTTSRFGQSTGNFEIGFKIVIMNGRYLVDTSTADLNHHGVSEFHFEYKYFDIFNGKNGENALYGFFKKLFNQKISNSNELIENGNLEYNGKTYDNGKEYLAFFRDEETFRLLVKLGGYNVRRFYRMILGLANLSKNATRIRNTKKEIFTYQITKGLIYEYIVSKYIRERRDSLKNNDLVSEIYPFIFGEDKFLENLVKKQVEAMNDREDLKNPLFFQWFKENPSKLVRTLIYYGILTPITTRRDDKNNTGNDYPIYLIDLAFYIVLLDAPATEKFEIMNNYNPFESPKHYAYYTNPEEEFENITKSKWKDNNMEFIIEMIGGDEDEIRNNPTSKNLILRRAKEKNIGNESLSFDQLLEKVEKYKNWERKMIEYDKISEKDAQSQEEKEKMLAELVKIDYIGNAFATELIKHDINAQEIKNMNEDGREKIREVINDRFSGTLTRVYNNL